MEDGRVWDDNGSAEDALTKTFLMTFLTNGRVWEVDADDRWGEVWETIEVMKRGCAELMKSTGLPRVQVSKEDISTWERWTYRDVLLVSDTT